jgi:prolipoprotein diacylglyceryltransferase
MTYAILASIPSPPVNDFHLGPLRVTFYGLFIMTGVVIAWLVTRNRFVARGGSAEIAERIVIRVVVYGFLGARLAYVSTHLSTSGGR